MIEMQDYRICAGFLTLWCGAACSGV